MHKGTFLPVREMIADLVHGAGDFKTTVHWPLDDPNDFPTDHDAVIFGGSPLNPDEGAFSTEWGRNLIEFIRANHGKKPMLGICFGHQAIAKALGGKVEKFDKSIGVEVGALELQLTEAGAADPLFRGVPKKFTAMFSHFFFVKSLPEGGVELAMNNGPSIQAYRIGRFTYGVQFHPDYSCSIIEQIVKDRKEKLSSMVDLGSIVCRPKERHDPLILDNFLSLVAML